MKILRTILKSIGFASAKGSTRYAINTVQLKTVDGKSSAVATNGRILAILRWKDDAANMEQTVLSDHLKSFGKLTEESSVTIIDKEEKLVMSDDTSSTNLPKLTTSFPDYNSIIPSDTPLYTINLNPKLFAQLLKALAPAISKDSPCFTLEFRDSRSPLIVRGENDGLEAVGAIMPVA